MTLFRGAGRHPRKRLNRLERLLDGFSREIDAERARRDEMPPRPPESRSLGADTAPRPFASMGPVNPASDPCGAPPISSSEKGGAA